MMKSINTFKPFQSDLTSGFESISKEALKSYLPNFAQVKSFGKNTEFRGYAHEKIRLLASEMNINVDEEYLSTIASRGTQDLGLDVVGWIPLIDKIGNYVSIFGQCACGKDWNKKLNETRRYNKFLKVYLSEITHSLFIPYSLINYNNSNFFEHHEFGVPILLFERKRILSLIGDENVLSFLSSKELIEKCLGFEEDIV